MAIGFSSSSLSFLIPSTVITRLALFNHFILTVGQTTTVEESESDFLSTHRIIFESVIMPTRRGIEDGYHAVFDEVFVSPAVTAFCHFRIPFE